MDIETFIKKYKLSNRRAAAILKMSEGAIRHWRSGEKNCTESHKLLIALLDYHKQTTGEWWPER
jgi:DNA-binding transcriptional regulator YiaG